jgi:hypothetical protein
MPTPPEKPQVSEKVLESARFIADMEMSVEETGELMGLIMLSTLGGGIAKALKDLGIEL